MFSRMSRERVEPNYSVMHGYLRRFDDAERGRDERESR